MTLLEIFESHTGRTVHKLDAYFPIYERYLRRYVSQPVRMIEIGAGLGGSAQMWKRWFGDQAQIISLDVRPKCRDFEEDQITVRIGHQADHRFLHRTIIEFGTPDIVIDDGSHIWSDQIASFEFLYRHVAPDGVYLVEDVHTSFISRYGGGPTFIDFTYQMANEMHSHWMDEPRPSAFMDTTSAIHVHDSVVVFERGVIPNKKRSHRVPEPTPDVQTVWPMVRSDS
jgi:hypothetical protein